MTWFHRHRLDGFVVLLAAAETAATLSIDQPGRVAAAVLAGGSTCAFLARRRQPLVAACVPLLAFDAGIGLVSKSPTVLFFGLMASYAIAAAINTTRDGVIAWALGAAGLVAAAGLSGPSNWLSDAALTVALCTVMWVAGWLVSRHTRRADVMTLRAEAAERARTSAVRDERARIARELHDVVSHGLSVVVVQTLAARGALADLAPGEAEVGRHLDAVESTARDALGEMRRMLDLLQVDDLAEPDEPAAGLRDLPALVDRARNAGVDVGPVELDVPELPAGLDLAVYRIVQEALTNAVKHAPGARVAVSVRAAADGVDVQVEDDGGSRRSGPVPADGGHGLVGMRERVALYGGTLTTGRLPDGGFRVAASLPIPADRAVERRGAPA